MRIAVIGARGQLGSDLLAVLDHEVIPLGHAEIEISEPTSTGDALDYAAPDFVINAAAWNAVDLAEDEPESAWAVNASGPRNLARECATRGIGMVHVSTDYVFGADTTRVTPFRESDTPGPVSAYGNSKLAGEYFVRSDCPQHFVVRTSGVYGHAARNGAGKGNFVETMLRLGSERDRLKIVSDQYCTPTSSRDLAEALAELITTAEYGLYHCVNSGATTWCDFAREIFRYEGLDVDVQAIPSSEYPTKAPRPTWSVLDNSRLTRVLKRPMPEWRTALHLYLDQRRRFMADSDSSTACLERQPAPLPHGG